MGRKPATHTAVCAVCEQRKTLRYDGSMRAHGLCPGNYQTPLPGTIERVSGKVPLCLCGHSYGPGAHQIAVLAGYAVHYTGCDHCRCVHPRG